MPVLQIRTKYRGKEVMLKLLTKDVEGSGQSYHQGLFYWVYKLSEETANIEEVNIIIEDVNIIDYGVLLPKYGTEEIGVYTMVTKGWSTEMFGYYNFGRESDNYNNSDILDHDDDSLDSEAEEGWI